MNLTASCGDVPMTLSEPEFDQSAYLGRVRKFIKVINPFNLLVTNAKIRELESMLKQHEELELEQARKTGSRVMFVSQERALELRSAQTLVSSALHPDTNECIPRLMRVGAFIPTNVPIACGFILAAPTPFNTIFWQWINQTYNAALNYGNRNASSTYTGSDIAKGYIAAVSASVGISLAIRKLMSSYTRNMRGGRLLFFNTLSSFIACSLGGSANLVLMRRSELSSGIEVKDSEGTSHGKS